MRKKNYAEDAVQRSIIHWLRLKGFVCTSQGAGLIKSAITQRIANGLGYLKGSADIIVFIPYGCLHIEVKRPQQMQYSFKTNRLIVSNAAGKQSESQKEFQEKISKISGHFYLVVTDVQQVIDFISSMNIKPF